VTPAENEIASGAEILQQLLIGMSLGVNTDSDEEWPVFIGLAPAQPDYAVICYDTAGLDQGRIMSSGERIVKPGVQVRVRGLAYVKTYQRAKYISLRLAEVRGVEVAVSTSQVYTVLNVSQPADIVPMGLVTEGDRNNYNFTVNVMLTLQKE
jgi:hypothetical protein